MYLSSASAPTRPAHCPGQTVGPERGAGGRQRERAEGPYPPVEGQPHPVLSPLTPEGGNSTHEKPKGSLGRGGIDWSVKPDPPPPPITASKCNCLDHSVQNGEWMLGWGMRSCRPTPSAAFPSPSVTHPLPTMHLNLYAGRGMGGGQQVFSSVQTPFSSPEERGCPSTVGHSFGPCSFCQLAMRIGLDRHVCRFGGDGGGMAGPCQPTGTHSTRAAMNHTCYRGLGWEGDSLQAHPVKHNKR